MAQVIAVVGGSCSGKTKLLERLPQELKPHGIRALCVPETPTIMINGAVPDIVELRNAKQDLYRYVQDSFVDFQISMEDHFHRMAKRFEDAGERVVIFTDRGVPCFAAFMDGAGKDYAMALQRHGLDPSTIFLRYPFVLHMVTAAYGAESYFSNKTNPARLERDVSVAREKEDLIDRAWSGHSARSIIDNISSRDFNHKLERAIQVIKGKLGITI